MKSFFLKRYPSILQSDENDCGSAAFTAIARYYGYVMSLEQAKELVQVHQIGQSVWDLSSAAKEISIEGRPAKADNYNVLKEVLTPFIAHYGGERAHFIVVYEVHDNYLVICDPANGLEILPREEFEKRWSGYLVEFEPTTAFKKTITTIKPSRLFLRIIRENKGLIIPIMVLSIVLSLLGLASSFFVKIIIDQILPNKAINSISSYGLLLIGVYLMFLLLASCRALLQAIIAKRILSSSIMNYLEHVAYLPVRFHETRSLGNLYQRIFDINRIQFAVGQSLISLFSDTIFMVVALVVIFYFSVGLSLVVIGFIPLLIVVMLLISVPIRRMQRVMIIRHGEVADRFVDSFVGIKEIKIFASEDYFIGRVKEKVRDYISTNFKLSLITQVSSGFNFFILSLLSVSILWYGTTLVAMDTLTLGSMMLFFSLMAYITSPIQQFSTVYYLILDAFAALDRVQGIIDIPLEKTVFSGTEELLKPRGKIECRNVSFGYRKDSPVLNNVSFTIEPGQLIAIVGETGVGKTTLVHLLCGFYPADTGEILVDDKNMKDISIDSLRRQISFVPQRSHLFRDSLYRNITMGRDIPIEEIEKKIQDMEAFKFLDMLPQRLYSPVFSGGSNFSSGQIQRISILRSIIEERPILIFDEATSNLDSGTEKAILDLLRRERSGKTTIIIGHRLSTIALTDKIFVMQKGCLVESGSFRELLSKKGVFYTLFQAQLEAEKNAK